MSYYDLWEVSNLKCYIQRANYAEGKGIIPASEKRLLTNILNSANQVIKHGGKVADLRFDMTVIFLLYYH